MARSFSLMGLPKEFNNLQKILGLKEVGQKPFKEYFYSDGYEFKIYQDQKGQIYEEFEAGCPWDGGPILFLGLKKINTGEIVCSWTASQMGFTEQIEVPEQYHWSLTEVFKEFVQEENEEKVKGYCPLYVYLSDKQIDIYQSRTIQFPRVNTFKINLDEPIHGSLIRDFLTQEGYSVEETEISSSEYISNRNKYLKNINNDEV
jgi:hypothetical protein